LRGIEVVREHGEDIYVKALGGEVWHEFVLHCISNEWAGIENLSLIPGKIGASPMQNIGAYGVELKDVFYELEAWNIEKEQIEVFDKNQCQFAYRESIFKNSYKNKYIILSVTFKLSKTPNVNVSYGAIEEVLKTMEVANPGIKEVSDAVIAIRSSKLPNPAEIGNAGSFFKNPVIENYRVEELKKTYPKMPSYPVDENLTKIPAGWLIDQAGWKGKTYGEYGVHKNQALVLVNYGGASGNNIKNLAAEIQQDILDKYGIVINPEVHFI
jgi:UDP-N-acetylmuramate dehydrogenase